MTMLRCYGYIKVFVHRWQQHQRLVDDDTRQTRELSSSDNAHLYLSILGFAGTGHNNNNSYVQF